MNSYVFQIFLEATFIYTLSPSNSFLSLNQYGRWSRERFIVRFSSKAKPKQTRITFDAQVKAALKHITLFSFVANHN